MFYFKKPAKSPIKVPSVSWIGNELAFCENEEREKRYRDNAHTYLKVFAAEKDGVMPMIPGNGNTTDTSNKPFFAFGEDEFLGVLEGTNLAVCINAAPISDGHIQFVEIPAEGETPIAKWHNAAEYDPDMHFAPLMKLSESGGSRGFVGFISGVNTFAQFHMQAFPEKIGGQNLPLVNVIEKYLNENPDYANGYKEFAMPGNTNSCFMYSEPAAAVEQINLLAKDGYTCDVFMIRGQVLLFPVDRALPNVIDPADGKNINTFLSDLPVAERQKAVEDMSVSLGVRPSMEKAGFLIKVKPDTAHLQELGTSEEKLVNNFWQQVQGLFPKKLKEDV